MMGLPQGWKPNLQQNATPQPANQWTAAASSAAAAGLGGGTPVAAGGPKRAPMPGMPGGQPMQQQARQLPATQPKPFDQAAADAAAKNYANTMRDQVPANIWQQGGGKAAEDYMNMMSGTPGQQGLYDSINHGNNQRMVGNMDQANGVYNGTPYQYVNNAGLFQRPGQDPNAAWSSGGSEPVKGVDQRVAQEVFNPNAYQYGGQAGLAQSEAARYGGLADTARTDQAGASAQYQNALWANQQGVDMSDQARQQQMQGLGYLQNMAQGNGPSAAQSQMAQGLMQSREQQASIAASARGGGANLAAAQSQGSNAAATQAMQGIQATGALRAQEQANAMAQYGQQAGALRTSDFGRAQLSGQQQQLAAGQQQFAAGQASQYEQYMQQVRSQQQGYQQSAEQQNLAREAAQRGWNLSQQQTDNQQTGQWIQAGTAAAGTLAMLAMVSDERMKRDVTDASADVDDAFSKLAPRGYNYKDEMHGAGPQVGIMAQHLASSKAGSTAVMQGDDGVLRVKIPQALGLAMAGIARATKRLDDLEKTHAR